MAQETHITGKNILGYTLQQHLGSGAYGEVWSAVAPGGISKAVKLIYGYHDERRAQNELKSLNRIKEVRHPFLLSLERIEVVHAQLVVISELAEMSLKDRFDKYREAGDTGIPRHELLGYLRDAADALDYISESHSLQHLDVKPENLLLMGGHVKVADFGLVKDVQEATLSMMAGLTPAYASPEMFDGRPGRASDQYSLAIVYQEMLTGVRPFSGNTAAQLAAQHLKGRPQLDSLPRGDQGVILRALSKNPELRFSNCSEMMEELANPKKRSAPQRRRRLNPTTGTLDAPHEDGGRSVGEATMQLSESSARLIPKPSALQKLPALELPPGPSVFHPTLLIGLGKTGAATLRKVKRRLASWLGGAETASAIRFLAIDVDGRTLSEYTRDDLDCPLNYEQVAEIPLRRPEDYRNDVALNVTWLSRRWIYNVPRSLQTEGIRPLGRLAFVDHCEATLDRIQREIRNMSQQRSIENSARALGFEKLDRRPRVIVVGSIAGGTGSGIFPDLGYALRTLLSELEVRDYNLIGMMIHAGAKTTNSLDLTVGNTLACLTELNHYFHTGYPGDPSCGLPSFEAGTPAYTHNYLIQFGDPLGITNLEECTDNLAEYVYLNTASKCGRFFDAARANTEPSEFNLRTIGLSHTGLGGDQWSDVPARLLSCQVVQRWMDRGPGLPVELQPDNFVERQIHDVQLSLDNLRASLRTRLDEALGGDSATRVLQAVLPYLEPKQPIPDGVVFSRSEQFYSIVDAIELEGEHRAAEDISDQLTLRKHLAKNVRAWIDTVGRQFRESVTSIINRPDAHMNAARDALVALSKYSRCLTEEATKNQQADCDTRHALQHKLRQFEAVEAKKGTGPVDLSGPFLTYIQVMLSEFLWSQVVALLRGVESQLNAISEDLSTARRELEAIIQQLTVPAHILEALSPDALDVPTIILSSVVRQISNHIPDVERKLREGILQQTQDVYGLITSHVYMVDDFIKALVNTAQRTLADRLKHIQIDRAIRESGLPAAQIAAWVETQIQLAAPSLNLCGGASRLFLGLPEHSSVTALGAFIEKQYRHEPTVVAGTRGDVVVCFEVDRIPIENVAYSLLETQPQCCDLVPRLLSRIDVDWSRLTEVG